MKRLVPFFAVLSICLLACLGWVAGHPQTASAHFAFSDGDDKDHDRGHDGDKDRGDDHDCRKDDRDHDRKDEGDHDRKHEGDDDRDRADHDASIGSFLATVTNYGTNVASRSVITLHRDRTMSVIDSNQGGPGTQFSSQLGAWKRGCDGAMKGRTIDFSFPPSAGIARVDYTFDADQPEDTIKGTIVLTTFPLTANPLDGGGTVVGHFEFTGTRIKVP